MKTNFKTDTRDPRRAASALVALFAAMAPGAHARHRPATLPEQPATVVAHVPLAGSATKQMDLQDSGSKQYLYIGANASQDVTVLDVTNPAQPSVIKRFAWPNQAPAGRLQLVSGGLALVEGLDSVSITAGPAPSTRTVKVLDLSDPANPRVVLTFAGVTSTLNDEAHNLVYIANSEGLWIVRNNQALAAFAKPHACTSDDAYNDVASCQ